MDEATDGYVGDDVMLLTAPENYEIFMTFVGSPNSNLCLAVVVTNISNSSPT